VALAVRMSRQLESRCCGLARWVPSHGFALVQMLQTSAVLCALWLTTDTVTRACVITCIVAGTAALTYALQPYTLGELNDLDMLVSLVVVLHVCMRAAVPTSTPVSVVLLLLHGVVVLRLAWSIARGTSRRARLLASRVRAVLGGCLPELKAAPGVADDSVEGSSLPSVSEVLAAVAVSLGCVACKRRRRQGHEGGDAPSGAAQWTAVVAAAASAVAAAKASKPGSQADTSAVELESLAVAGAADALHVSRTAFDACCEALSAALCVCCGATRPRDAFGSNQAAPGTDAHGRDAHSKQFKPDKAGQNQGLAGLLANIASGAVESGQSSPDSKAAVGNSGKLPPHLQQSVGAYKDHSLARRMSSSRLLVDPSSNGGDAQRTFEPQRMQKRVDGLENPRSRAASASLVDPSPQGGVRVESKRHLFSSVLDDAFGARDRTSGGAPARRSSSVSRPAGRLQHLGGEAGASPNQAPTSPRTGLAGSGAKASRYTFGSSSKGSKKGNRAKRGILG